MPKTKLLVARVKLSPIDVAILEMYTVAVVKEFQYLWSVMEAAGGMNDHHLNLETKRLVYHSVVLGVLLHGPETWAPKQVWLKNWRSFNIIVYVILWVLGGLYSGQNISPLPS